MFRAVVVLLLIFLISDISVLKKYLKDILNELKKK